MANICSAGDKAPVSSCESSSGLGVGAHSSFFVSPRFPDQSDSLTVALQRAFGHKDSFFCALMSMEVPDKVCLQLHLLHMHRRNFRFLTITQALSTLRRFLTFLKHRARARVAEIRRSDLEALWKRETKVLESFGDTILFL